VKIDISPVLFSGKHGSTNYTAIQTQLSNTVLIWTQLKRK